MLRLAVGVSGIDIISGRSTAYSLGDSAYRRGPRTAYRLRHPVAKSTAVTEQHSREVFGLQALHLLNRKGASYRRRVVFQQMRVLALDARHSTLTTDQQTTTNSPPREFAECCHDDTAVVLVTEHGTNDVFYVKDFASRRYSSRSLT